MLPLTDSVVFHVVSTRTINDNLSSYISESTQGRALGRWDSCAVDWHPVAPLTAETVAVSKEMSICRETAENTVTGELQLARDCGQSCTAQNE